MPEGADNLPRLTAEQMADIEAKLVVSGLQKLNTGQNPTGMEMDAIKRAGERYATECDAEERETEITELGLEVHVTKRLDERGIHDGSRLLERKPEVFNIIARLLAHATPVRDICSLCQVSEHTVQSVAEHPAAKLPAATQKAHFTAKLRLAASLGLEGIIAKFKRGEVTAVEWGIVVDKLALAEGGVTARTEHIHRDAGEDDFDRLLAQARQTMVIEAELIPPKALPPAPERAPVVPIQSPENASKDTQSPESQP